MSGSSTGLCQENAAPMKWQRVTEDKRGILVGKFIRKHLSPLPGYWVLQIDSLEILAQSNEFPPEMKDLSLQGKAVLVDACFKYLHLSPQEERRCELRNDQYLLTKINKITILDRFKIIDKYNEPGIIKPIAKLWPKMREQALAAIQLLVYSKEAKPAWDGCTALDFSHSYAAAYYKNPRLIAFEVSPWPGKVFVTINFLVDGIISGEQDSELQVEMEKVISEGKNTLKLEWLVDIDKIKGVLQEDMFIKDKDAFGERSWLDAIEPYNFHAKYAVRKEKQE